MFVCKAAKSVPPEVPQNWLFKYYLFFSTPWKKWRPHMGIDASPWTLVRVLSLQWLQICQPQAQCRCLGLVHPAVPQIQRPQTMAHNGGYCAQPPCSKSHGTQASPPSSRCTAHGQGLKSWGGGFIFQKPSLKPPTTVGKGPTMCRRLSKPLIASTLVGGVLVKWDNFYI